MWKELGLANEQRVHFTSQDRNDVCRQLQYLKLATYREKKMVGNVLLIGAATSTYTGSTKVMIHMPQTCG